MLATLSETFWLLVLGVVVMFAFFAALGAFEVGEAIGVTIAVVVLAALWLAHAMWVSRHTTDAIPRPSGPASGAASESTPSCKRILDAMPAADGPPAHEVPVEQARAAHVAETEHLAGRGPDVAHVRDDDRRRRPRARLRARGRARHRRLPARRRLGAWATLDSVDAVCRALADESRRARGQHRLPARARAPVPGRRSTTRSPSMRALDGRSSSPATRAGGNLAAVVARQLRDRSSSSCCLPGHRRGREHAVLRASSTSATGSPRPRMRRFWNLYLDGADGLAARTPRRCARPTSTGVAPAYILTAEPRRPARRGRGLRAPRSSAPACRSRCSRVEGTIHGFWRWQTTAIARARRARGGAPRSAPR